eukprot:gnl/TRDRNA2_/TRDRNA2_193144_c0_seq1.p1 gnl/TRDRNA2_/TRDRNA2_193144_c0~~gnl/TRDRNA2_/TRDRNA2_193144_c0_seq1.p1  ORF type:complete len:398 (+),score=53.59 gnl/TRDRNA2_/TRDRNA2_193144_c0_seq1:146-1195(+)
MTPQVCCNPKPGGNPACWDAQFTFEKCCSGVDVALGKPQDEVASLKVSSATIKSLPLLGGGTIPMTGLGLCCRPTAQGDFARQAVLDYLMMGGRHLDDASIYNNHWEVGEGVRQAVNLGVPRGEIFLTTKIPESDFGFEATMQWVDRMLAELGLEYVDLVLLHSAGPPPPGAPCRDGKACRQETWLALQRAKREGKVKHLGVSNFGERQMTELMSLGGAPIEVNQLEYHPWAPKIHFDTVDWCHKHSIVVTAYGSMGSNDRKHELLPQSALVQIGQLHGKTAGQVLLRWAIQNNVTVIPGTSTPKHMGENLRVFDFNLGAQEMNLLDGAGGDDHSNYMLNFGHWPDKAA